jgi:hypothetical protein
MDRRLFVGATAVRTKTLYLMSSLFFQVCQTVVANRLSA